MRAVQGALLVPTSTHRHVGCTLPFFWRRRLSSAVMTVCLPRIESYYSHTEALMHRIIHPVGATVPMDEIVCVLQTEQIDVEISTPIAGVLERYHVQEGTTVLAGGKIFDVRPVLVSSK